MAASQKDYISRGMQPGAFGFEEDTISVANNQAYISGNNLLHVLGFLMTANGMIIAVLSQIEF